LVGAGPFLAQRGERGEAVVVGGGLPATRMSSNSPPFEFVGAGSADEDVALLEAEELVVAGPPRMTSARRRP